MVTLPTHLTFEIMNFLAFFCYCIRLNNLRYRVFYEPFYNLNLLSTDHCQVQQGRQGCDLRHPDVGVDGQEAEADPR